MEYYHYVNIFETKGLEYILVICFLITFAIFVMRLEKPAGTGSAARDGGAGGPGGDRVIVVPDAGAESPGTGPQAEDGSHPRRE